MKKLNRLVLCINIFFLSLSAYADSKIDHHQGTYSFTKPPEKVVTFDLASLDTMNALGVDVIGLPKTFALSYLEKFNNDKYVNVGSLFEPNYEVVSSLEPDLVIVANRSMKAFKDLSKLAPTIDLTVFENNYVKQVKDKSVKIAQIFGKEAPLKIKLKAIEEEIDKVKVLAKKSGNALFLLTNGGKISAFGKGSRFGWLHEDLGITPVIEDIKKATHGDPVSFEFILDTNPDWIFVLDRDSAIGRKQGAAKALLNNELINKSKAAMNNQIVYVNAYNWYVLAGGLTALDRSVQEVLTALEK